MNTRSCSRYLKPLGSVLVIVGTVVFIAYGTIALISREPLWFLGRASVPAPERIVVRVDGQETVLVDSSPGYDLMFEALEDTMSTFDNTSPRTTGLSEATLAEYRRDGVTLEFYFSKAVDFYLPFNDGNPTALLIPIQGRHGGQGYVFRGKRGKWWAGQMVMSNPQPLLDALSKLGYIQQ